MRWSTFVKRQPAQPVSDDPADVFEHGAAPRHRLTITDVFYARMRGLGEAAGAALNDLVRRRMEQSRG